MKTSLFLLLVLSLGVNAAETASPSRTAAYQGGVAQEHLRVSTQRLKDELIQLITEFSKYPSASGDVAALKKIVKELDKVAAGDMAAVSKILLEASRNMDDDAVNKGLTKAVGSQKGIQVTLRSMADRLAQQSGLVSMEQRLEDLAIRQLTNLKATRKLAEKVATPKELERKDWDRLRRKKQEQSTLDSEIHLALDVLKKMISGSELNSPAGKALKAASQVAKKYRLRNLTGETHRSMDQDFKLAISNQEKVLYVIKAMIKHLDNSKTEAERKSELAADLKKLAEKQKALADETEDLSEREQAEASKEQEEIASELDLIEERARDQDKNTESKVKEAKRISEIAAKELGDEEFTENKSRKERTKRAQDKVAEDLDKLADDMQKEADQLAGTEKESTPMTDEEKAMKDAMNDLSDAKSDLDDARRQNKQKEDSSEKAKSAAKKIADALEKMGEAGDPSAKKSMEAAKSSAEKAGGKKQVGHNLHHAAINLAEAMGQLQEASNEMAAKSSDSDAQSSEMSDGDGDGGLGNSKSENKTKHNAQGIASDAQRDALTMQNQDKVSAEYEPAVSQYLKNLAEDNASNP